MVMIRRQRLSKQLFQFSLSQLLESLLYPVSENHYNMNMYEISGGQREGATRFSRFPCCIFYRTQVNLGSDLWVRLSVRHKLRDVCVDLTDVTLADEDTNSILTDNANRAIQGNVRKSYLVRKVI